MKIAIHSNELELSRKIERLLREKLEDVTYDVINPDVVISIGGDGTVLSAFHRFKHLLDTVSFVAVHTGHLGFYTDFVANQMDELVRYLKSPEKSENVSYPLIELTYQIDGKKVERLALNEMTLRTITGTLVCEVYINDNLFEVFRGDGLCVSTPTGSTGISKSLGGAVLHPCLDAMQLTEIAALNNRVYRTLGSPMILPASHRVTFKIKRAMSPAMTIDNFEPEFLDMAQFPEIEVALSTKRVTFKDFKQINFWSRVETSFIGEIGREALNVPQSRRRYKISKTEK